MKDVIVSDVSRTESSSCLMHSVYAVRKDVMEEGWCSEELCVFH